MLSVVSNCEYTQTTKVRICILNPLVVGMDGNSNCISCGRILLVKGNLGDVKIAYLDSEGVVLSTIWFEPIRTTAVTLTRSVEGYIHLNDNFLVYHCVSYSNGTVESSIKQLY